MSAHLSINMDLFVRGVKDESAFFLEVLLVVGAGSFVQTLDIDTDGHGFL